MKLNSWLLRGFAICTFVSLGGRAHAQQVGAPDKLSESLSIESITVTARHREEIAQRVPVAVTAIGEAKLTNLFVRDLTDLNQVAPNFTIQGAGAIHRNAAVVYTRGLGYSGVDQGLEPAVGIAMNGVFYARNIGALQGMFDVEQVELLRGPQGTLFGKNTIGGVVNVTSKKPSGDYSIDTTARLGNYGRVDLTGAADIPLTDNIAARIAVQSQYSDGPYKNTYVPLAGFQSVGSRRGGDNVKSVRGTVVWQPVDVLTLDLVGTYIHDRSPSVGGQNGSFPTDRLAMGCPVVNAAIGCYVAFTGQPGFGYPGGPTDPYKASTNFPSADYQTSTGFTLNGSYHAEGVDIVSVTGYIHSNNISYNDYDESSLPFYESIYPLHHEQFSQEVRFESPASNSPAKWVGGILFSSNSWNAEQTTIIPFLVPAPNISPLVDFASQKNEAIAGFGQIDYAVTEQMELSAGIRYTFETKDFKRIVSHPVAFPAGPTLAAKKTWSNFTYHAGASYRFADDVMAYASFNTGFLSGGFNSRAGLASTVGPFEPTTATAYELGLKSEFYGHRLRINAAAFWNVYKNLQVQVFQTPPGSAVTQQVTANAANERARGIELEATAVPVDNLLLTATIGYDDAEFTSFLSDVMGIAQGAPVPQPFSNCNGLIQHASRGSACFLRPIRAPLWTSRLETSYSFNLDGHGTLTPDVVYTYKSTVYSDLLNSPQGRQPGKGVVNASLNYEEPQGRWRLSLWAKNLTNEKLVLGSVPTPGTTTQLYFSDPRTFGIELNFKLGS